MRSDKGFGLVILIILMAVAAILTTAITFAVIEATRSQQLRFMKSLAYYAAQAGIMESVHEWWASGQVNPKTRRYKELDHELYSVSGDTYTTQKFKTGNQAAFAFFQLQAFTAPRVHWVDPAGVTGTEYRRLQAWAVRNIHIGDYIGDGECSTSVDENYFLIRATKLTVWWEGEYLTGNERLTTIALTLYAASEMPTNIVLSNGNFRSGQTVEFDQPQDLCSGERWYDTYETIDSLIGEQTYLEWDTAFADTGAVKVTVQWTFADGSQSDKIVLWDGTPPNALNSEVPFYTLSMTSTGRVFGNSNEILAQQTLRARISGLMIPGLLENKVEIIDWDQSVEVIE